MQFYEMELVLNRNEFTIAGGIWVNPPSYDNECPVCGKPVLEWPDEIEIELKRVGGAGFVEVLPAGPLAIFRQDVIDLWRSAGFTGFTTRPVRILGFVKGKRRRALPAEIPQYQQLVPISKVALKKRPLVIRCPACGYTEYDSRQKTGLHVDVSTWDGSSIFGTDGTAHILCVREVAEVTLQAGLGKSIPFVRAEEWNTWEDYNVRNWGDDIDRYWKMREQYIIRRVEDL
jgi:hypothetical protein